MRNHHLVITLLVAFFTSLSLAAQTVDIHAWPLSAAKSQSLARITYNSTHAAVKSYTAPTIPAGDELVRVGFYSTGNTWSGVATASSNLSPVKDKTIQLHLNAQGQLYHIGFRTVDLGKAAAGKDGVRVEVIPMRKGPTPHLNKPVVVTADGHVEGKEPEKTFFQKYWWIIGAVLLIQVVMGGGGKE